MRYAYGQFDGHEFPTPDKLFGLDQLMQFILQHGDQALRAIEHALKDGEDGPTQDLLDQLLKDGMFDKDGRGRLRLTPRAVSRMQMKALNEVFSNLQKGTRDGHEKLTPGAGSERTDGNRPYTFGDPVADIDMHASLRNAMQRSASAPRNDSSPATQAASPKPTGQIEFSERDFEIHQREGTTSVSTVVLIDLSGSMMRYHRYLSAKKVALALLAMVRQRFPNDTIDFVGFYSGAKRIPEVALPLVMPKPVTIFDHEVRMKCPIDQIDKAPQHFTNLHLGLQMARKILRTRAGENKQVFIITDGQPTAHVEGNFVHLIYPPDDRSTIATLKEAAICAREDIRLASFALIEDYWGMDWVGFIDQLTRLTRGVAFYTSSGELAQCVMESYLSGKRKKAFLGR